MLGKRDNLPKYSQVSLADIKVRPNKSRQYNTYRGDGQGT
jgi:hypothetical protein